MAVKIRSTQLELADNFVYSGAVSVPTPSQNAHAATKAYVDSQLPDALQGGDGIAIATGSDPDVVSVDLATNSGLEFASGKIQAKVKAETGGTITKDANGLYIADSAISSAKLAGSIANAKLANSTISGKALGANLDALSAGQGLALASPYTGQAAQTIDLKLDGGTLAKGSSGVKIADNGIAEAQLSDDCVTAAQMANGAINSNAMLADAVITGPKLAVQPYREKFVGNGSAATFSVSNKNIYTGGADGVLVFRNGLLMELKASSPSGQDEYTVANNSSNLDITFGTAPTSGDTIFVMCVLIS